MREIRVRALRKLGELTSEIETRPGRRKRNSPDVGPISKRDALDAAGISKQDASRAERIADIDEISECESLPVGRCLTLDGTGGRLAGSVIDKKRGQRSFDTKQRRRSVV